MSPRKHKHSLTSDERRERMKEAHEQLNSAVPQLLGALRGRMGRNRRRSPQGRRAGARGRRPDHRHGERMSRPQEGGPVPVLSIEIIGRRGDLALTQYQQIRAQAEVLDALTRLAPTPSGLVLACAHVTPWPQGVCVQAWCHAPSAEIAGEALAEHLEEALSTTWEWMAGPDHVACADN